LLQDKTNLAVLFADVSDSTRLYEAIGDTAAFGNVREVVALLKGITEDGCAGAAGEMHRQVAQRPPLKNGKQLTIRVGFHYGPVIEDGNDVFGDSVNVAARMAGLALPGQAITDAETAAAMSSSLRDTMRQINAMPVKGKAEEIEVHELMWQTSVDRTVIPGRMAAPSVPSRPSSGPKMKVLYRGREIIARDTIFLGRDDSNTIFIMDPMASRRHAKIELRAGKFVLIDQSSNGTFVIFGANAEMHLRREEVILHGNGRIAFGHSLADSGVEMVEFDCG
jgi:adenylate cyclase